jgi:hypothetical protein
MASSDLDGRATFICGHPKSGTSLLRAMLDSHPQLIVFPEETKFFRRVLPQLKGLPKDEAAALVEEAILGVFRWNRESPVPSQKGFTDRDYSHRDDERVRAEYRARLMGWRGEPTQLLSTAIVAYGAATGQLGTATRRWVEKSPYNERYAYWIYSAWPEALCLHVVRDPRDNYASYRLKHPDWSPEVFASSWARSAELGRRNTTRFGSERYRILRYEDLVGRPEVTIETLTAFLGIDDDESLRRPTRDGQRWGGNSMFGDSFRSIDQRPRGRYETELSERQVRTLERELGDEMARLGYPLSARIPVAEKLWARFLRTGRQWRASLRGGGKDPLEVGDPAWGEGRRG